MTISIKSGLEHSVTDDNGDYVFSEGEVINQFGLGVCSVWVGVFETRMVGSLPAEVWYLSKPPLLNLRDLSAPHTFPRTDNCRKV